MSATLDSELFARYFHGAPALTTHGRTFPVQHLFLEDAIEAAGYLLPPDSPAALRGGRGAAAAGARRAAGGDAKRETLLRTGWGDEEAASVAPVALNPYYDPNLYLAYSDRTNRSLARLNEEAVDLDLIEALLAHIDEAGEPGAVLVFLPGASPACQPLARALARSRAISVLHHPSRSHALETSL